MFKDSNVFEFTNFPFKTKYNNSNNNNNDNNNNNNDNYNNNYNINNNYIKIIFTTLLFEIKSMSLCPLEIL